MRHRNRISAIAIALLVSHIPLVAQARVWTVDPNGGGDAPTIQAAVDSAVAGDEVRLAPGTYTWSSQGSVPPAMIRLKPGLLLRGAQGASVTVLDAEFFETAGVIRCDDVGSETRIEGLTITRARSLSDGAGIQVTGNSSPMIVGCIFRDNRGIGFTRGGAVGGTGASLVLEDCQFIDNGTNLSGGAVFAENAIISRCVFVGNETSADGGAFGGAIAGNTLVIRECIFEENRANGVKAAEGGAIAAWTLDAERCVFRRNGISGGLCSGGAVFSRLEGRIVNCDFVDNFIFGDRSARGGALAIESPNDITECVFLRNEGNLNGTGQGGAVFAQAGATIENCTLVGNRAGGASGVGGIYMDGGGTVQNSIIAWSNGQACAGTPGATWICTNLFGNGSDSICGVDGNGNFSADPEFCAADPVNSESLGLQSDSPCAPNNHPDSAPCGLMGARGVECASVRVALGTWTSVKSLYR